MKFRTRLAALVAIAVAIAIAAAAAPVYVLARATMRDQLDDTLRARATRLAEAPPPRKPPRLAFQTIGRPRIGRPESHCQIVFADGRTERPPDETLRVPVDDRARSVAAGRSAAYFKDAVLEGAHVRIYTAPLRKGAAVQVVRSLEEIDDSLSALRMILIAVAAGGIGLAAGLGALVARMALVPVRRLTETTEQVAETRDLGRRIEATGRDELSRLAANFNTMMAALEQSVSSQTRLVSDASHELRTPLASLRMNADVLARNPHLSTDERELVRDLIEQLDEMKGLVEELVELARGEQPDSRPETVALDELVTTAVERTRRDAREVEVVADVEPTVVVGIRARIERAIANLLDNAVKWSPRGGLIEVRVRGGEVSVRDHGPGIDDGDLPHVFDRFYRAPAARGMPGSGLGLSIVRQVAESHGGMVSAERPPDGGTRIRLRL